MYVLNSISSSMRFKLGTAATTNQVTCVAAFEDRRIDAENGMPGNQLATSNNTTIVSIVDAPTSGVSRTVQQITVYNADTAAAALKIYYTQSGTDYTVFAATLESGSSAYYEWKQGWTVVSSLGDLQTSGSGGGLTSGDNGEVTVTDSIITLDQDAVMEHVSQGIADSPTITWEHNTDLDGMSRANWVQPYPFVAGIDDYSVIANKSMVVSGARFYPGIQSTIVGDPAGLGYTFNAARWSNDNTGPWYSTLKSRGTSPGSYTVVADGDYLGGMLFNAADGTDLVQCAYVVARVDTSTGAISADKVPCKIVFNVSNSASGSLGETFIMRGNGDILLAQNSAAPATCPSSYISMYAKTDGIIWSKTPGSSSIEYPLNATKFNFIQFTRDTSLASGSQAVTGAGFTPRLVFIAGSMGASSTGGSIGWYVAGSGGGFSTLPGIGYVAGGSNITIWTDATGGNYNTGQITSLDSDGFTISWTKGGAATGTATMQALVIF